MKNMFKNKRKTVTAIIAVALTAVLIFGGTFAWQSISQQALNEVSATRNPGGRLHDDFNEVTTEADLTNKYNKDVYVENFTSLKDNGVQVFARVRLDEYMEFGDGAGGLNDEGTAPSATNKAKSLVDGAKLEDKSTWSTYRYNEESDFRAYWIWDFEGSTVYMPTFNKNKDSLEADINGTFKNDFEDHTDYVLDATLEGTAVYDADDNTDDEVGSRTEYDTFVGLGNITTATETHTAKNTLGSYIISMDTYIEWLNNDKPDDDKGNFWVYDEDGWAYWANPIDPDTATGLLLDGIQRTDVIINEDWYYGINVVAQFITKEDIGDPVQGTGFFDTKDGSVPPSDDALLLLNEIGVDVTFEVDNADELKEALAHGGNIILNSNVTVDTNLVVSADTTLDLNGHTINNTVDIFDENSKVWSLISVQGADTTLTINGGNFVAKENDCFAVDVRDGAKVIINDGSFVGNISAVYVHSGSALINGGTFSIQQPNETVGEGAHDQMINAYDANYANGTADITICGGTFYGFNPTAANDAELVPTGYSVSNAEGVYTVTKTTTE